MYVFVLYTLAAVRFRLLLPARRLVGKTAFCTGQLIGWEDRLWDAKPCLLTNYYGTGMCFNGNNASSVWWDVKP